MNGILLKLLLHGRLECHISGIYSALSVVTLTVRRFIVNIFLVKLTLFHQQLRGYLEIYFREGLHMVLSNQLINVLERNSMIIDNRFRHEGVETD